MPQQLAVAVDVPLVLSGAANENGDVDDIAVRMQLMARSVATNAERTILTGSAFAAFVLDLEVGLANRIRHCFIALLGGLAKRDFLDDASLLGDDSFFVMLFGLDGAIDKRILGSSQRRVDSAASDFDILVAKREIFANRGLRHIGTNRTRPLCDCE